ncbi:hypothetical protein F0562_005944 [Nyssa sinensis]|uniref:Calponin-homology (CH) domain-containing protein n=1 Tax=Nyssa sinensis TaxID=561372 RepID=A0A5J5AJK2_9ASTE|nr:hypothetical protein F0562_005944 [Nyssa sinensis]
MGPAVPAVTGDSSSSSAESNFRQLDDVFLQTQTRIWLGEVIQTRLDEQLHISDLLADGELLFEVSKVIWKMLLAKCMELRHVKANKYKPFGSRKSSGRYRPYSNVDSFLKICKILGLNGIDLFSPSDVVEQRNIRKVCMCIRLFSMKARSKQLNVPDFDIVTYTVAMSTNMVGGIRRSLELSQFSFSNSASVSPYERYRSKYRKKKSIAACERNYDSCSEESDSTESNYMGVQSYSSSTNYSCDAASFKNSNVENSPEVSSMVKKYGSPQNILQSEILDQERDEVEQSHYESECLTESVGSVCSQYVNNDRKLESMSSPCIDSQMKLYCGAPHIYNGVKHIPENGARDLIDPAFVLGNDASIMGDSLDDSTAERGCISHQLAFSDFIDLGTDSNYPVLFDGEDSMINLYMGTDSHGSILTQRTSRNGFARTFFDDIEDVEVSSITSMNSVSGRRLSLDFDDRFDADDYKTVKVNFTELQNYEADRLDKSPMRGYESQDMDKYETSVHNFTPDTEKPETQMKIENFGFSTKLFLQRPDDSKSDVTWNEDTVDSLSSKTGKSQINSGDALWLKDTNFVVANNDEEAKGTTMVELDTDIEERRDNNVSATCSGSIINIHEDSVASCNTVAVEEGERCHRINKTDDGSGLQHLDIIIEDIISKGANTVISATQSEPTAQKHPFSAIERSPSVGTENYQACTDHNEDFLHRAECTNKDEGKNKTVDSLAEEISDGRKYTSAGVPESKPHRRPLLKTVVKGTAIFGVLFLLLHVRNRSGREKRGEANKRSSRNEKSNGVEFPSWNEQKGRRVNGIYPAQKLKLGN